GRETCPYAVSTTANWVTITGDGNGVGNSTVQYRVDPYFLGGTRQATIVITLNNGLTATHTITQTDECVVSVDATTSGFNQNGGSGNFAINLQQSGVLTCPWEASTTANWVTIASDSNGTGNSELSFTVDPWFLGNGVNAQRTATIVVRLDNGNTATHTITQTNECDVTAVPATAEYEQGGGFGQFTAQFAQTNQLDCPWNVTVSAGDEEWVTIVGTTEGTGTSTISYEVKPFFTGIQPNPSRTAVITVTLTNGDTSTHTITQVDNCNHTLVPTSLSFTNRAEFGSFNVNFTTTPDRETQYQCPWIARVRYPANAVDTDWVEIVEGSTEGSGDGLVTFYVDEFNSLNGERTAFIDVILDNGLVRTFTIIQRDPCQFAVTPSLFFFDHNGVLTGPVFDPLNAPEADDNTGTAFITVQFLGQPFGFNYADCEFSAYVCTSNAKCSAPVTVGNGGTANPDESWINIQEITVNQASGEAQVFFEVDPNIVTGPDQGRFAFIVIEGKNGQIATVRVEQSSSYFRLGELELADTSEFDAPGGLVVDQEPFGFGENAIVIGYTDILDNQVIEQEGLPNAPYFTVVDPKTGQVIEAELSVITDQRGFITGEVTLNNFINETSFEATVLSSTQEADATVTIPVTGRIVYRRSSVTNIQTDENNFAGTTDVTYNSSFVISGKNKFASFKATGTDKRKEVHQFTPGQSLGFDVVVTAAFKTGNTNAKGTERAARLYGWNPTVVDLAVNKNSFLPKDSRKRVYDAGLVLLDSDYSIVGQQGVGTGLFRQFPQIGSKNGKYTFTGKFSSFPQITFRSVGLHNASQEVFLEEGFPLYLLERGVNVFPQSTVFSNGQVTITGRNVWAKNLTVPQNPSN
ncbi:MAG: hypothetical protein SFY68_01800, partial [Candidatus Sumerlaeia bacterium]|nr:hypothetical protein [Candidatus Sumerlaeia bacterium]